MDKIICLGKNYEEHITEMREPAPATPVLFLKPPSTLLEIKDGMQVNLPWKRGIIHHECEIVFKLYKKNIIGLGLGLDLTLRDVQKELKAQGHPWEISKTFKNSSLVTPFKRLKDFPANWQEVEFTFKVNGEIRQQASLSQARLSADAIIHYVDQYFQLCDGDLIFTGTPKGVGPLNPGDELELIYGPLHHKFRLAHEY